ncbi:RNA methyltransferase, TrmH family, group 3 [Pilobolus umbonatus]|nr:RNA methyltransferase, TrmH family, group 3 [Pilobolus umbonatus]
MFRSTRFITSLCRYMMTNSHRYTKPYRSQPGEGWDYVYGISSVLSALQHNKRSVMDTVYIQTSDHKRTTEKKDIKLMEGVLQLAKDRNLRIESTDKGYLNNMTDNKPHQGVVLKASPIEPIAIESLKYTENCYEAIPKLNKRGNSETRENVFTPITFTKREDRMPFWIALDEVQDPQNLGSILRTAYFFGVDGVILCSKNSAPLSGTVSKVSSGAMEAMDIYSTTNLAKFLKESHNEGWSVVGAAAEVEPSMNIKDFKAYCHQPVILVLGNEGTGLRTNIKYGCNTFVSIPNHSQPELLGQIDSLNVGVAAGILISSALI